MILHKFPFGPFETNAVLLGCAHTKAGAVIDPALGSTSAILEQAAQAGLSIGSILITHSHWDHIADAHELIEKTKAPIYVHPLDAQNLERPGCDRIPVFVQIQGVFGALPLQEGNRIAVGALTLEVIHTPGHSPGSVCFYLASHRVLFSGDTLFKGSIGNLHLPTAEPSRMWGSLRKLAKLPKDTRVVPGHGPDTTLGQEGWLERAEDIFS